jgi:hypothetical protein
MKIYLIEELIDECAWQTMYAYKTLKSAEGKMRKLKDKRRFRINNIEVLK